MVFGIWGRKFIQSRTRSDLPQSAGSKGCQSFPIYLDLDPIEKRGSMGHARPEYHLRKFLRFSLGVTGRKINIKDHINMFIHRFS